LKVPLNGLLFTVAVILTFAVALPLSILGDE